MIRFVKYAFLALLALSMVTVFLGNRAIIELRWLPDELATLVGLPNMINLPLYMIIFASVVAGFALGQIWEWFREHKLRADGARAKKEANSLQREVKRMQRRGEGHQDDVLELLEGPSKG